MRVEMDSLPSESTMTLEAVRWASYPQTQCKTQVELRFMLNPVSLCKNVRSHQQLLHMQTRTTMSSKEDTDKIAQCFAIILQISIKGTHPLQH